MNRHVELPPVLPGGEQMRHGGQAFGRVTDGQGQDMVWTDSGIHACVQNLNPGACHPS